ncbi:cell growth regulator with EF hand domain protein 1 isoform X2 [Xenopus laevis]|uniref:Cell growth regulator with EF hand domain protein 1 isoform X2 n=1 Tax=Xenopus laevis TaxID=8355 RepID=A0A8J1KUV3_XENLA|nr:cell growth regulator with EF hand domain protein 1 isoform X2 [Xenopus laevis]
MRGVCALLLPILLGQGWAAPRTIQGGSLLQGYLKEKDPLEANASNLKRETAILHLFLLHDYDKSGRLDGLELMRLLSGILSHASPGEPTHESVIHMVDEVLERQDLNRDGLLSAPELVTPPIYASEEDVSQDNVSMVIPPPQESQRLDNLENPTDTNEKNDEELQPLDVQALEVEESLSKKEAGHQTPPTNSQGLPEQENEENKEDAIVQWGEDEADETVPDTITGEDGQQKEKTEGMHEERRTEDEM